MVNIGVIGCGHWGPNLVRNFVELPDVELKVLCDLDENKVKSLKKYYPSVNTVTDYKEILDNKEIDAVAIATPAKSHYALARECLLAGKHILVEKPLALSSSEGADLLQLSEKYKKVLMVGHTFLYNPAIRELKKYIKSKEIGDIYYIFSQRLNLGQIRRDVNAMWNFAPHDISIILHLIDEIPIRVNAKGLSCLHSDNEDIVFLNLDFKSGINAHIHISWLDPVKVRRMVVVGSKKMIVYDDISADSKIQIYDKGVDKINNSKNAQGLGSFAEFQLKLRSGDIHIPRIDFYEPLKEECAHFIDCIKNKRVPLTDGKHGLMVVKILEVANNSIKQAGAPINFTT
ncbi:MAG: Gfo/Idh/MocA family oxidoreductase [Candidatus Omnitrophota bacterium]